MRPLTDTETKTLFEKLANYTGKSLNNLLTDTVANPHAKQPDRYVFRVQKDRVYYVRESLANLATSVARDSLLSLGTCLGKFTKTGKFRLHITALDVIAPHARYKVWVKANGEMPFLYGGHVVKAHIGRWSEDAPEHAGAVVMSMNDTPLVSGRRAKAMERGERMWRGTDRVARGLESRLGRRRRRGNSIRRGSCCFDRPMWASTCVRKTRCSRRECEERGKTNG
jgi:60S ribosome subunit biogenesis protein NIP7